MNPAIFREYDIRGVAERDFDADFARRLGGAYAAYLNGHGGGDHGRVAVGRDCRLTSDAYAEALIGGLTAAGLDVLDLGVCPTPLCYFAVFDLDLTGGIQVTGSHNPSDHNGFKICAGRESLHGEAIQEIRRLLDGARPEGKPGRREEIAIVSRYRRWMRDHLERVQRPIRVVVDAGNATAGPVAPDVLRDLGCQVDELYCTPDGRFPNHHPDPTVDENLTDLIARVRATGAEVGIGFDGDADRIGVVDGEGQIIRGDDLLVLYARDVLRERPGATIVSEVKCSQRLFDDIQARGGHAVMWKSGHSPIKARMRESRAALGGELSGHMFFADRYFGYDDAIYAAARLVEILSRTGDTLPELLADLPPSFVTPEIRVDCPDQIKFAISRHVAEHFRKDHETIEIDGVRVLFDHGWGLLRASNTQPALVLRVEAEDPDSRAAYQARIERAVTTARAALEQSSR